MKTLAFRRFLLTALCAVPFAALAQTAAPSGSQQPLRLISPASAGGPTDIIARVVAEKLQANTGQAVIVEPRPGASGIIGTDRVAKSPPDGLTLAVVSNQFVQTPSLMKSIPYDYKDMVPVVLLGSTPFVYVARPDRPYKTIPELLAFAKANPGKVTYATAGAGTTGHLFVEWLKAETGAQITHVQYSGSAQALTDVVAGHVDFIVNVSNSALPHIRNGSLRALAVTSTQRMPALPDVPTLIESGHAGMSGNAWFGLVAPPKTPAAVVSKLNADIQKVVGAPEVKKRLAELGMDAEGGSDESFARMMNNEHDIWAKVIRSARIDKQ